MVKQRIKNVVVNYSAVDSKVYINDILIHNPTDELNALKRIRYYPYHHSGPTKNLSIKIITQFDSITVRIGRDATLPYEYYVYYDGFNLTKDNNIGKMHTHAFDKY